jgi:hypothetical protein
MAIDPLVMQRFGRSLVRATCTTTLTTVYTVGTNQNTQVLQIEMCNTSASALCSVTVILGGKKFVSAYSLQPGETLSWEGVQLLHSADTIQIMASANSTVEVHVTGIEG